MKNEQPSTWEVISDKEFREKLEHSYQQSLRGEGKPLDKVFDELEQGLEVNGDQLRVLEQMKLD